MRRRAFLGLVLAAPTAALVGLPAVTAAWGRPRPVPPSVTRLPLTGVDSTARAALRRAGAAPPLLLNAPTDTAGFSLLGVTWLPDSGVSASVEVRTRRDGRWSPWLPLDPQGDHYPDGGVDTTGALRHGTSPRWVGPCDGVQARLYSAGGPRPRDVRIELVDPGTSPADDGSRLPRALAWGEATRPPIITRAEWGADESIRRGSPSYNSTVKVGFVHHTASSNDYTPEQAAAMVRGIYAYHVKSNGWSDIGYNYLVDRYGRAYEGRAGGLDRFVVGAHTGGFNKDTFAVALLGNFSTVAPDAATVERLSDVLAWKLGSAYREPLGTAVLTSAGGGTSKYSAGQKVTFDVISGHRDAGNTSCPGATTYSRLAVVREQAAAKLGAGFVDPVFTGGKEHEPGARGPLTATATTRGELDWTTTVEDADGAVLRSASGRSVGGEPVSLAWDLTDAEGRSVRPGTYVLRLAGSRDGDRALPYEVRVVVKGKVCRGNPLERVRCKAEKRPG